MMSDDEQSGPLPAPAEGESALPARTQEITVGDKTVYLLGTAHVSADSVEDVRRLVEAVRPDAICVELCASRHRAMTDRDAWRQMNIFHVLRERKALLLLVQLMMTTFYKRIGEQLGSLPGAEMMEGVNLARRTGAQLVLADREIEITLRRVWGHLRWWTKVRLLGEVLGGIFLGEKVSAEMVEEIKESDQLDTLMKQFSDRLPGIRERLIDERDVYLAQKIRDARGPRVVAVVGAAHVPGITAHIQQDSDLAPLMEIPPRTLASKVSPWIIPAIILGLVLYGFLKQGAAHSVDSVFIWILVNGTFSALGALAALAHPLTILTAFFAAPLTSLNPMLAAGWVAGLVQAALRRPTVADLEDLPHAMGSLKTFWQHPLIRILLVVALCNLGSTLGTILSGVWIAQRSL